MIVPSMTFVSTVQAVLATGARPRFADIDPGTLCVTADRVAQALTPAVRAVIPVHYGGRAVDLDPLQDLLDRRGVLVVEDAAHSFGSHQDRRLVGADPRTVTCFSFGPIKNLTCGQGGMIIPRGRPDAATARRLRMLGVTDTAAQRAASPTYTVAGPGFRAQLPALNAAIGLVQLEHFPATVAARQRLWRAYRSALANVEGITLVDVDIDRSVPHLCTIRVPADMDRDLVFRALREHGIAVGVHYPPDHLQPAFAAWRCPLPHTERAGHEILTLPFHPHLTEDDTQRVAAELDHALTLAGRRP